MKRLKSTVIAVVLTAFLTSPLDAGVIVYEYDALLGTTPEAQGWTLSTGGGAGGISSVSGGLLTLNTTSSNALFHNWSMSAAPYLYSDQVVVEARMRIRSSSLLASPRRAGYYLALIDNTTLPVWTGISDSNTHFIYDGENYSPLATVTLNDGEFHEFRMTTDSSRFQLFVDDILVIDEPFRTGSASSPNFIGFGDFSNGAGSNTDIAYFRATIGSPMPVPEPSSILLFVVALATLCVNVGHRRRLTLSNHPSTPVK